MCLRMICIKRIKIRNFRSIKEVDLLIKENKITFVGQNNSGKSNINRAIDIAFNNRYIPTEYDINMQKGDNDFCYIDIMLTPKFDANEFNDDWTFVFGSDIIMNEDNQESFSIRTVIQFDEVSNRGEITRFPLLDWYSEEFNENNDKYLSPDVRKCIKSYYLDTSRDISNEIRVKSSNFSNLIKYSNYTINNEDQITMNKALEIVNRMILKKLPSLNSIEEILSDISTTVHNVDEVKISPIANNFDSLSKGIELNINSSDKSLPISVYGDGTRSWVSVLTLSAYINTLKEQMHKEGLPFFSVILLEEPESHLHPQGQNKIINQLNGGSSQFFITTHSSHVVSELNVTEVYRVSNYESSGTTIQTKVVEHDYKTILNFKNLILPYFSEILFTEVVVFVEGLADKILITEYLKLRFEKKPFEIGVLIVETGGKDNLYLFRLFCELHAIQNAIFADKDAEKQLIKQFRDNKLSLDDIYFTEGKEIENDLIKYMPNLCLEIFIEYNNFSKEYLEMISQDKEINDKVLHFLIKNKTLYPHLLSLKFDSEIRIPALENITKFIGRGIR